MFTKLSDTVWVAAQFTVDDVARAAAQGIRGDPQSLAAQAAQAGYDIAPVRALVDMLAGKAG